MAIPAQVAATPSTTSSTLKAPFLEPPSEDALKLRRLTQKLKRYQEQGLDLPEEIQEDIQAASVKEAKSHKKTMHSAINAMDQARQHYEEAVQARNSLHTQWKQFLADSVALWRGHAQSFQTQEHQLSEQIQHAKEAFVVARDAMTVAKAAAASMVPVDTVEVQEVSDDEQMKDLKEVPTVTGEKIASGLQSLTENLSQLHQQTEEMIQQEQRAKRQRIETDVPTVVTEEDAGPASARPSQHFVAPGGK